MSGILHLIESGMWGAEVIRRDGEESRVLTTINAGHVIGEIGYVRAMERIADIRAISKISVLKFDYERMQNDLKYFPNIIAKLNFNISHILGERLADMADQSKK